jgi:hypothetical protein
MLYDFKCKQCEHIQPFVFPAVEYDKFVMEDGRIKRRRCEKCKAMALYRYVDPDRVPGIMGGSRNYMSMERYWSQNPGEARKKEDELSRKMADRHHERVTKRIDKQTERSGSDKRHKDYGEGQGEQRLKLD